MDSLCRFSFTGLRSINQAGRMRENPWGHPFFNPPTTAVAFVEPARRLMSINNTSGLAERSTSRSPVLPKPRVLCVSMRFDGISRPCDPYLSVLGRMDAHAGTKRGIKSQSAVGCRHFRSVVNTRHRRTVPSVQQCRFHRLTRPSISLLETIAQRAWELPAPTHLGRGSLPYGPAWTKAGG